MARRKKLPKILKGCLIFCLLWASQHLSAQSYHVGNIYQLEGKITFYDFYKKQIIPLEKMQQIFTSGSYLSQDNSFLTIKIVGGHYLRLNPKSKISIEYDPDNKALKILLLTGSVKAIKFNLNKESTIEKFIFQSGPTFFETTEAKFSINRNLLEDTSSVFVEKGIVLVGQTSHQIKTDMELVHKGETLSIHDRQIDLESARKMKEKEIKFLHPSFYLKKKNNTPAEFED